MKSTGIVRRIDELGRIVIPKELRKTLKIKEGESLEVFINNDEIILKKFSNMNDMDKIFDDYIKILNNITGNVIFITDRDKIRGALENKKNTFLDKPISENLEELLDSRKSILSNGLKEINILEGETIKSNYYIVPLIVNSDVEGLLIMLSTSEISDKDKMTLEIVSKILINYME